MVFKALCKKVLLFMVTLIVVIGMVGVIGTSESSTSVFAEGGTSTGSGTYGGGGSTTSTGDGQYKENPSLTVWASIEKIPKDCKLYCVFLDFCGLLPNKSAHIGDALCGNTSRGRIVLAHST